MFDGIYKKLERELHMKKKEMAAIVDESKRAHEQRLKATAEMGALKAQTAKDKADFEREWAELGRLMEADKQAREAAAAEKAELRGGTTSAAGAAGGDAGAASGGLDGEFFADDGELLGGAGAEPQFVSHLTHDKIAAYEEAWDKMQAANPGLGSVEEAVETFAQMEDKNFSLFNFINEQNSEIEKLELMIGGFKAAIEKYKGQGVSTDTQRKKVLRDLEESLQARDRKADECEAAQQTAARTINQLKAGITAIFSRLASGTTSNPEEEILVSQGVTESNMMQYLLIIEHRTAEILNMYAQSQSQASAAMADMTLDVAEGTVQPAHARLNVQPPAWEDFDEEEEEQGEDDERPLTRDELQRKTLRSSSKKDAKAKTGKLGKK